MNDAVFVDIDQTLVDTNTWDMSHAWCHYLFKGGSAKPFVCSPSAERLQAEVCGELDKVCVIEGSIFISRLRPGAREFLQGLRGVTPKLYALSAGTRNFQVEVLKGHGLFACLDELYGRESLGERDPKHVVPVHVNPLLIDDQPVMSMLAIAKLNVMRLIKNDTVEAMMEAFDRHYIQIHPFDGDAADVGFATIAPEVQKKLAAL
jgi:hypothetical protein